MPWGYRVKPTESLCPHSAYTPRGDEEAESKHLIKYVRSFFSLVSTRVLVEAVKETYLKETQE